MIALNDGEQSFSYWRSASAARKIAAHLGPLEAAWVDTLISFSGITLSIMNDTDRAQFLEAVRAATDRGVQISFDPNYRPHLWQNATAARNWIMQAVKTAHFVLPSFEDENGLFGDDDPTACAKRHTGAGVSVVVVKNGAQPVLIWTNSAANTVPTTVPGQIVDTTSAGDSFNAAFLLGLISGDPLPKVAQHGCKLAASVVSGRGALVPVASSQFRFVKS